LRRRTQTIAVRAYHTRTVELSYPAVPELCMWIGPRISYGTFSVSSTVLQLQALVGDQTMDVTR